jgi:hypothetical protein
MLQELFTPSYSTVKEAKKALTTVRKRYRVALRGSVAIPTHSREGKPEVRLHVNVSGSGFNSAELSSVLRCL